jgi:glycosyltransferase involved in cell wall biosynthesis
MNNTNRIINFVVPTCNRYKSLIVLLSSITKCIQNYQGSNKYSITVVDDGSSDETNKLGDSEHVRVLRNICSVGPAGARNKGMFSTESAYIVFLDDDCNVPLTYLESIDHVLQKNSVADLIAGGIRYKWEHGNFIGAYLARTDFLGVGGKHTLNKPLCVATANLIVKRCFVEQTSLHFDESFRWPGGEDDDFVIHALHNKAKITFEPSIFIWHDNTTTFLRFCKRYYCYGYGHVVLCLNNNIDLSEYSIWPLPFNVYAINAPWFLLRCVFTFWIRHKSLNVLYLFLWIIQKSMIRVGNYRSLSENYFPKETIVEKQ